MRSLLMTLLAVATLAGCATTPSMTTQERFNLYVQHAGLPVQSFQLARFVRHTQWTPLGDRALAVWTTQSRGHLLELRGRCSGLAIAHTVEITNSFGTVNARWDSVVPTHHERGHAAVVPHHPDPSA
jgi:hypothetical protein